MRLLRTLLLISAPAYGLFVAGMIAGFVPLDPLVSLAVLGGFAALVAVMITGALLALAALALRAVARRILQPAPLGA